MKRSLRLLSTLIFVVFFGINSIAQCTYSITLLDDYGDGWNGGKVTVFVNGTAVLTDITEAAAGPTIFTFQVSTGDDVTTTYTAGSWSDENYYNIKDPAGVIL